MFGKFIVFEGVDGTGKSTALSHFTTWLKSQGESFVQTSEPGGTPFAMSLRAALKNPVFSVNRPPMAELWTVSAARCDHVQNVIKPALLAGKTVVCDRFTPSTFAYQGEHLPWETIRECNRLATEGLEPGLVIILDVSSETAEKRKKSRGGADDSFDSRPDDFWFRTRERYHRYAQENPNVRIVSAEGSPEEVSARIVSAVVERFPSLQKLPAPTPHAHTPSTSVQRHP